MPRSAFSSDQTRRSPGTASTSRNAIGVGKMHAMRTIPDRAIAALEALPEEIRERAVEYLEQQAENLAIIRAMVAEAEADIAAGRVGPLDMDDVVARARRMAAANSAG